MRTSRALVALLALLPGLALGQGLKPANANRLGPQKCLTPSACGATIAILPDAPVSSQLCAGKLSGNNGVAVQVQRASGKVCEGTNALATLGASVAALEPNGLLVEAPHTNYVLQSGSLASGWTVANVATGVVTAPDGTASGALQLTDDATTSYHAVYQDLTALPTSAVFVASAYVKNGTANYAAVFDANGQGCTFRLSDGVVTWSDSGHACASGALLTNGFRRIWMSKTSPMTTERLYLAMNPGNLPSGFPLYSGSGSTLIYADVQAESGATPHSWIATTGSIASSNADLVHVANIAFAPTGSLAFDFVLKSATNNDMLMVDTRPVSNGFGPGFSIEFNSGAFILGSGNGTNWDTTSTGLSWTLGQKYRMRLDWSPGSLSAYRDGALVTSTATPHDVTGQADLSLLGRNDQAEARATNGWVSRVVLSGRWLTNTAIAMGDSITQGTVPGMTQPFPTNLQLRRGSSWRFYNGGVGGNVTSQILSRWETYRGLGYRYLILMGGINDMTTSVPVATALANLEQMVNEALSDGMLVRLMLVTPCQGYATCGTTVQSNVVSLNAGLSTFCATKSSKLKCLDTNALLRDPGNTNALLPVYDNGDHLHPSQAGLDAMATFLNGSLP